MPVAATSSSQVSRSLGMVCLRYRERTQRAATIPLGEISAVSIPVGPATPMGRYDASSLSSRLRSFTVSRQILTACQHCQWLR